MQAPTLLNCKASAARAVESHSGHMTGRLLRRREGYQIDIERALTVSLPLCQPEPSRSS